MRTKRHKTSVMEEFATVFCGELVDNVDKSSLYAQTYPKERSSF